MVFLRQALVLAALAFVPAIGQAVYFRDKVSWQTPVAASDSATLAQAKAWGDSVIWVDARPDEEFARDHVPGAISLNEDHWDDLLPGFFEKWSPDKKVVVYCSSQSCNASREVARRLRSSRAPEPELKNVFVLAGGWEEWLKQKR